MLRAVNGLCPVLAAGLASAGLLAGATDVTARPAAVSADISISQDSAGSAMFTAAGLRPGTVQTRCIVVSSTPSTLPVSVQLYAEASGPLTSGLQLRVDVGHGGGFDSCAGFSGTPIFDGSLSAFAAAHADFATGLPAWQPDSFGTTSYRFTTALRPEAVQGASATARFVWESQPLDQSAVGGGSPTPPPAAALSPSEGSGGSQAPPSDAVVSADPGPTEPVPRPTAAAAGAGSGGGEQGGAQRKRTGLDRLGLGSADWLSSWLDSLPAPVAAVGHLLAPLVRRPALPMLWVLLVLVFLAVQDQIDRRDPKLALAPVFADDVMFPESMERFEP